MAYLNGWTDTTIKETISKNFKGKAVNKQGICQYLTACGKKCGIGIFIPDGHYAQYDRKTIDHTIAVYSDLLGILPLTANELYDLQEYHDKDSEFKNAPVRDQKVLLFNKIKSLAKGQ